MGGVGHEGLLGPQLSSSGSFSLPLASRTRRILLSGSHSPRGWPFLPVAPGMPWRGAGEVSTRAWSLLWVQAAIMLLPKGLLTSRPSSRAVQGWGPFTPPGAC